MGPSMTKGIQRGCETVPQIKTVRAEGRWKGQYRNDLAVREFSFTTAEPEKIGGRNEGPTPIEYVAAALNGCLGIVIELVAKERGILPDDLKIESAGLVDQRGLFGTANVSPHFQSIDIAITLASPAPNEQIEGLKRETLKRCPVYNLVRDSGAQVSVAWSVQAGEKRWIPTAIGSLVLLLFTRRC